MYTSEPKPPNLNPIPTSLSRAHNPVKAHIGQHMLVDPNHGAHDFKNVKINPKMYKSGPPPILQLSKSTLKRTNQFPRQYINPQNQPQSKHITPDHDQAYT